MTRRIAAALLHPSRLPTAAAIAFAAASTFAAAAAAQDEAASFVTVNDLVVTPVDGAGDVAANTALVVAAPDAFPVPSFTATLLGAAGAGGDGGGDTVLAVDALHGSTDVAVVSLASALPLAEGVARQVRLDGADGTSRTVSFTPGASLVEDAPLAPSDATLEAIDPCYPEERVVDVTPPPGAVAMVLVAVGGERAHAVLVDGNTFDGRLSLYDQVVGNENPAYQVIAVDAAGQESEPALVGAPPLPEGGMGMTDIVGCNAGGVVGGAPAFVVILGLLAVRRRR